MPYKGTKRADAVPSGPIARAMQEWLKEHGYENLGGYAKDASPYLVLSDRVGLMPDTLTEYATVGGRRRYQTMSFDIADKLLAAVERTNWWWQDPELAEVYEPACKGADLLRPIAEPDPEYRTCEHCSKLFEFKKVAGPPRRFCSRDCVNENRRQKHYPPKEYGPRTCAFCEEEFTPKRKDSRFCCFDHTRKGLQKERRAREKRERVAA